jgi:Mn2+/Fe2+ NRAMP family transporter
VGFVALSTVVVSLGGYHQVERVARVLAGVLLAITVVAAVQVGPSLDEFGRGLVPGLPGAADPGVIVPWIGTILAGSMGIVWFAYWAAARGFGAPRRKGDMDDGHDGTGDREDRPEVTDIDVERLRGWTRAMAWAAATGVVGGAIVITAFVVLGSELLAPQGIVPEGADVADDLARLLADVWGRAGFWLMIVAVVVALGGSVLANQDGWGRSFADMTRILAGARRLPLGLANPARAKRAYIAVVCGLLPVVVLLLFEDPVGIMSVSGTIGAVHTPVIVAFILWVNRAQLPKRLRPGIPVCALMVVSAVVYAGVGAVQLVGG